VKPELRQLKTVAHRPSVIGWALLTALLVMAFEGCSTEQSHASRVLIWHQMLPDERVVLQRQIRRYRERHPGVQVEELYRETEDLRSGFVIATLAGQGPDLVYGPSDPVGIYEVTKTIRPLESLLPPEFIAQFDSSGLLWYRGHLYQVADKIGNHLALVYNKRYIQRPPETDRELLEIARAIQNKYGFTAGRPNVYGLAWNYIEPFFFIPFLTGFGGWVFAEDGVTPTLDTPEMVAALRFVRQLRDEHKIVPKDADYNVADALFKDGKSAMLINGDWSWAGYRQQGVNIGVAPLPKIVETGLWCAPMTSPKGYSLNVNVAEEKIPLVLDVLKFLVSEESQLEYIRELGTAPTLRSLATHPLVTSDEIMQNSLRQIERGRPMPTVPEMRAVWDAMRPGYQAVMRGFMSPENAARAMQQQAVRKIRNMKE
jgi:maltose-binding protein MalE